MGDAKKTKSARKRLGFANQELRRVLDNPEASKAKIAAANKDVKDAYEDLVQRD